MEYSVIHGARKNSGDFLIFERAKKLLETHLGTNDFLEVEGWKEIDDDTLSKINKTKGLIICGGPGLQKKIYPGVYPLRKNLDDLQVPIFTLGSGWKGIPGNNYTLYNYKFSKQAHILLEKVSHFGVRDYQTKTALRNNGYTNVSMNGCPVWYDIPSIGKDFKLPKKKENIKNIVFTPAQDFNFHSQSIEVLHSLKKFFPNAHICVSFHRGIETDHETTEKESSKIHKIVSNARELNFEVKDVSYGTEKIKFYDDYDLHIGYRVHAHIYFLSKRLPSILIHEDGRGLGVSNSIGISGIDAWGESLSNLLLNKINNRYINAILKKILGITNNRYCVRELEDTLQNYIENGFNKYNGVKETIDSNYKIMSEYISKTIQNESL